MLNVGDCHAPRDRSWPPLDFPQHENKIFSTNKKEPNCDFYVDDYALDSPCKYSRNVYAFITKAK